MTRMSALILVTICLILPTTSSTATAQPPSLDFETLWKTRVDSANYGGARLDGTRLLVGTEDGVLRAFDKQSGELAWRYDAGSAIASNVAVDDHRAYVNTRGGVVHAVNRPDGTPAWTFATGGERQWDYWDYYLSTPAVDDRQVYFGSGDHHVYALDKRTGHLRWKAAAGAISHGEPAISGEKVIIGGFDGRMRAYDRGTGRLLWAFKTVGNAYFRNGELPGAATVSDGIVYFGGRDYNLYALLEGTGTGAWNVRTPSWVVGRPMVVEDAVIVVNSDGAGVFSYHAKTGQQNWQFTNSYNMFAGARPLGAAHVAVAGLDGRISVLDRNDGSLAGYFETEAAAQSRADYFTPEGQLDYTGLKSLEDLMDLYERQLRAMDGIAGDFAVDGDVIYYATVGGEVAALRVSGIDLPAE